MIDELDCDITVSKFELQTRNYARFKTKTLREDMDSFFRRFFSENGFSPK